MMATIPLRLPQEVIDFADEIIRERKGATSRNAVLRELLLTQVERMKADRGQK